jgi:hypothetical protein
MIRRFLTIVVAAAAIVAMLALSAPTANAACVYNTRQVCVGP